MVAWCNVTRCSRPRSADDELGWSGQKIDDKGVTEELGPLRCSGARARLGIEFRRLSGHGDLSD